MPQATPAAKNLSAEDIDYLTKRTQDGGTEVRSAVACARTCAMLLLQRRCLCLATLARARD